MTESGSELAGRVMQVADAMADVGSSTGPDTRPADGAVLRYGTVTALGSGANTGKVQTSVTGAFWALVDSTYNPAVGDTVYLMQQGPVAHVCGKLGGAPSGPPVGSITVYAGSAAPAGWLLCTGQAVSRINYAALFGLIGTTYGGGDGSSTFNVPNLGARVPVGAGSGYNRGDSGGQSAVALSVAQMPSHNHSGSTSTNGGHTHDPAVGPYFYSRGDANNLNGVPTVSSGLTAAQSYGTSYDGDHSHSLNINNQGGGQSFNNMPPYLVLNYIVRALP